MAEAPQRRAEARVDLAAVQRNCALLKSRLTGGAALCAVVKADGYGHGAAECAAAALRGGASWLAVVSAEEARALRETQPDAPLLVMGPLTPSEVELALDARADLPLWSEPFREAISAAAARRGIVARVHVKHDSGMGRLGEPDPEAVLALVEACAADPNLEPAGLWTHFATADEPGSAYFDEQLERFGALAARVKATHPGCLVHAANSAALLREPASHFDMARCGIAVYGLDPFHEDAAAQGLEPALELISYVAGVKRFAKGQSVGYGRRWVADHDCWVGVVPIGYGDGVRRGLTNNGEALIAGGRHQLVGTVSMDSVTVYLGPETEVEPGAEAVLIGARGGEQISAELVARRLGTINYEVTCGIASRVPRVYGR